MPTRARTQPGKSPAPRLTPWAVITLAGLGLIYAAYPSWDYYFDGLVFASAVESVAAGAPAARLFHPHHLLYSPLAWIGYKLLWVGGLRIRAWLFLQLVSAACGVATLWVFRQLALRLGTLPALADAGMALLGVSYIFWNFSTQGDTTIPLTLVLLLLLSALARSAETPGGPARAWWLGLACGAAALLHESAVILLPAAMVIVGRAARPRDRLSVLVILPATAGAVIVAGYAVAGVWGLGLSSPAAILGWARGYFGAEALTGYAPHYGRWTAGNLAASIRAFGEAFAGPAADGSATRGYAAAAVAGLGAAAAAALLARARTSPARTRVFTGLGVWLLTHAVFFSWWMPGHTRFWALALPGWCLLLVLGATELGRRRPWQGRMPALAWTVAAIVALTVAFGPFRRETDPTINRWLPITDRLAQATPPGSLVILSGIGTFTSLKIYVPYFATRTMLVLDWQFADSAVSPREAVARLRDRLSAMTRTRPVFVLSEALDPNLDSAFLALHGLTPAMRHAIFAPFHPRLVAELEPGLQLLKL